MNASEFAFLAIGLILGVASGAALVEVLRARPPAPREVRLTIAPDAVPRRRGTTLAADAFAVMATGPTSGGPADDETVERDGAWTSPAIRTTVRSGGPNAGGVAATVALATQPMVAFRVEPGRDPMFRAMAHAAMDTDPSAAPAVVGTAVGLLEPEGPVVSHAQSEDLPRGAGGAAPSAPPDVDGPCGEARHVANERCELAVRARAGVGVAEETLRSAQRAYDLHMAKAEAATAETDPAMVRSRKEGAQAAFRDARNRAATPDAVEAAARDWLGEINRINSVVRDAGSLAAKEHAAAEAIAPSLERLAVEADGARIKAESAESACVAARQAVAECVEATEALQRAADPPEPRVVEGPEPTPAGPRPSGPAPVEIESEPLAAALGAGQAPVMFLLLRGDGGAMSRTVARLADDPAERRRWQDALTELVEAIIAVSVGQSSLDFPTEHPFWGPFTREQDRDIVTALSSLGFRFDGLGGWVDERIPTQRDLSMAMGYAGLDPMRIRQWPTEAEMRDLFADVTVAADEHLAGAASDLTLGELVAMLGRRADGLAMLWNEWGRVRPLLLEDA